MARGRASATAQRTGVPRQPSGLARPARPGRCQRAVRHRWLQGTGAHPGGGQRHHPAGLPPNASFCRG
ncbi:hypothetical protein G6F32_017326 [Rhizopus arrhizus]|nr:hypothetical protein G6F32_017326 [Rhizopus arrhizus]